MTYLKNILFALDKLGNAISGGNHKCTISGRIGYYCVNAIAAVKWFWLFLQSIVDFAFYPIDGKGHCKQAYLKEQTNEFYKLNSFKLLALFVLTFVTLIACVAISVLTWSYYLIKLFYKKITLEN